MTVPLNPALQVHPLGMSVPGSKEANTKSVVKMGGSMHVSHEKLSIESWLVNRDPYKWFIITPNKTG